MPDDPHQLPFNAVSIGPTHSKDPRLVELIRWGRIFYEMGLTPPYGSGSYGNLSLRTSSGCLITATKTFLGKLDESHFVEIVGCDFATDPPTIRYAGTLQPSTDSLLHWELYKWRPEIICVLHAHDKIALDSGQRLGLPQTAQQADAGSQTLVSFIQPLAHHSYLLIKNHGFMSMGRTIEEAGQRAVAVHRNARSIQETP